MKELLTLNELLLMHLIDGQHKNILTDAVIRDWKDKYNEDPRDILADLESQHIVEERYDRYSVVDSYRRQFEDTAFIYKITEERPKLLDEHKAYLVYRNNRNMPEEELLIRMYDDILEYNTDPEKHQQAHVRLSELFMQVGESNHSENHMHCAQMLDTLLDMEDTLINVRMKSSVDDIRARFPIPNEFLERYKAFIRVDKRHPHVLRDDILVASRQLKWDPQHREAAANYIVLRAQDDRNAEKYLLAYLFKSAKVYNVETVKYMRKHRLDENNGGMRVMSTERRRVALTRPIEKPETRYEMRDVGERGFGDGRGFDDGRGASGSRDVRGSAMDSRGPSRTVGQVRPGKRDNSKKGIRTWVIILFLIIFFPVGLIMMWMSHWRTWVKVVISVIYALGIFNVADDDDDFGDGSGPDNPPGYEEQFEGDFFNDDPFFE